ncbi:MAG: 7-cyano-7-deazaguanine/7-aminomethyl-7-deazaguanine transporter [Neisseria sp.]|nr:7-cyano-7-deazaguanine/7-aminomethyl-7-deazaguanine transporter [Neisseria sp.]
MYEFTREQQLKALYWLTFWHIAIITASNYLVQFPFTVWGIHNTWGAFTFPFIFLTTDLTVRIFGQRLARKIILRVMLPALAVSYAVSVWFQDGAWTGAEAVLTFNGFVARIAVASFAAYVCGQLLDITVFNRLRRLRAWWIAPAASTVLGSAADTLVFFAVAFYRSTDAFMAANWLHIGAVDYVVKVLISTLFFLPAYGVVLKYLTYRLTRLQVQQKPLQANEL